MIKVQESYELFLDALSRLDERKLELSDEDLAYEILEELDSEYHSFLHEWTVDRLIEAGLIPKSLRHRILALRENIRTVMNAKPNIQAYRYDSEWVHLRHEANSILSELKTEFNKTWD